MFLEGLTGVALAAVTQPMLIKLHVYYINSQSTIRECIHRCYIKSTTAQNWFWPIPGLTSCAGVTGRWGLQSHARGGVRWLALFKWHCTTLMVDDLTVNVWPFLQYATIPYTDSCVFCYLGMSHTLLSSYRLTKPLTIWIDLQQPRTQEKGVLIWPGYEARAQYTPFLWRTTYKSPS